MAGRRRHRLRHVLQPGAVGVEGDFICRPVEAVLVVAAIGAEGERVQVKGRGAGGVVACVLGGGRLQDEVDGPGRGVQLAGQELDVDLGRVVEVLALLGQ